MAKRTEQEIIQDLQRFIDEIYELVEEYNTYDKFSKDRKAEHSLSMLLIAVGELCHKLLNEYEERYDRQLLLSAINMRNFLSHGYWDVDYRILWDAAMEDVPVLEQDVIKQHNK